MFFKFFLLFALFAVVFGGAYAIIAKLVKEPELRPSFFVVGICVAALVSAIFLTLFLTN